MHLMSLVRAVAAGVVLAAFAAQPSAAQQRGGVIIENAWAATTNPGATVAAGYATLRNPGARADRLLSAQSPRARRVELHQMSMTGGVMRMTPVEAIALPAGASVTLAPGGLHFMFIDIDAQFRDGERIPVTLQFERHGDVAVVFIARPRPAEGAHSHDH
jgi:hypothetical protein